MAGTDVTRNNLTLGLSFAHSEGKGNFVGEVDTGNLESRLNAIIPYGSWRSNNGLTIWGLAGAGSGRLLMDTKQNEQDDVESHRSPIDWQMIGGGVRRDLMNEGSFPLSLTTDFLHQRTQSDDTSTGSNPPTATLPACALVWRPPNLLNLERISPFPLPPLYELAMMEATQKLVLVLKPI